MSRVALIAMLVTGCWTGDSSRATTPVPDAPKDVAVEWVTAMLAGDATRAMQLSTVPFSFDRQRVDTLAELRPKLHAAADKASRAHLAIVRANVVSARKYESSFAVPTDGMVIVQVATSHDGITVLVRPDPPRVIGFRD